MACINSDNLLYVKSYSIHDKEVIKIEPNVGFLAKQNIDKDFFYIQFSNADSFSMFAIDTIVPTNVLERVRDRTVFLMLDNGLEHYYECADSIYKNIVVKHNIPAEQIIFLSAVPTMHDYVAKLASRLQLPEIKIDWFSCFEASGQDAARHNIIALPKKKKYSKKFLNLNRRWRLHRPLLITLLKSRNLLDAGYISFAPSDDNQSWNNVYNRLQSIHRSNTTIKEILDNNKDVQHLPPMYLDTEDLVTNRAEHEPTIADYYMETYFSVVNETTYYENTPFLSEKIFKTIGMGHPFIIATAPNSLQYLKELGYKTYDPFIDESYDNIQDPGDRMLAILNEVERLCSFSKSDLKKWIPQVKAIAKYNRDILVNKDYTKLIKTMNY